MSDQLPHPTLRSPISLGPIELRNRVVSTSHQTGLVHDYLPTADLVAYHEARARGGVGAIFLEATAMHPTGLLTAHGRKGRGLLRAAWLVTAKWLMTKQLSAD